MRVNLSEIEKLISDMGYRWSQFPTSLKDSILNELSNNISNDIRKNASVGGGYFGSYNTGEVANSVVAKSDGYGIEINFEGYSQHTKGDDSKQVRIAEIAFLNEYGVPSKQKRRNFIQDAIYSGMAKSKNKIEELIGDWAESLVLNSL